jgi:DNA-binding transcriptional regulator LsrR (DeoR family)
MKLYQSGLSKNFIAQKSKVTRQYVIKVIKQAND